MKSVPHFERKIKLYLPISLVFSMLCGTSYKQEPFRLFYRSRLLYAETFEKPPELLWCYLPDFRHFSWPLISASLQALVKKNKSVTFPVDRLYPVTTSSAEYVKTTGTWVKIEYLLHLCCQSIYRSAHICIAAGYVYIFCRYAIEYHNLLSVRNTPSTVSRSAPLFISAMYVPI